MPCIYSQFMEKEARQWRQIYKAYYILLIWLVFLSLIVVFNLQALQLLEYLIKHGSERVVDDARSHLSTIKMLRSFHYIDEKGKDQGINGNISLPPPVDLFPDCITPSQCEIAQKSWSNFSPTSTRFARNAKRPRPTDPSMLAPVTMGSLVADAMEGSGMNHTVVAITVVTMEPTRAGTIKV